MSIRLWCPYQTLWQKQLMGITCMLAKHKNNENKWMTRKPHSRSSIFVQCEVTYGGVAPLSWLFKILLFCIARVRRCHHCRSPRLRFSGVALYSIQRNDIARRIECLTFSPHLLISVVYATYAKLHISIAVIAIDIHIYIHASHAGGRF